jgi:tight adherence protein B
MGSEQTLNAIISVAVFGLVLSLWTICIVLWAGQYLLRLQVTRKRLGIAGTAETVEGKAVQLWRQTQKDSAAARPAGRTSLKDRLERLQQDLGWRTSVRTVFLEVAGLTVAVFMATISLGGGIGLSLGASAAIPVIFWSLVRRRINRQANLFETQLVDALGIAARSLRAGHPLVGAFQLIAEEIDEPLGGVFNHICQEQALGLDLREAIRKVSRTTHNAELKLLTTAVAIQMQSGGNLADLMDSLGEVIRARTKLKRRVRVLTAQTQLSKSILIGLPIVLFIVLNMLNPQYMVPLYSTTAGRYMLGVMIGSVLLGSWAMNRMSVLKF